MIEPIELNQPSVNNEQAVAHQNNPQNSLVDTPDQTTSGEINNAEIETSSTSVLEPVNPTIPNRIDQNRPFPNREYVEIIREPEVPFRIVIPVIQLEAPIIPTETRVVTFMGKNFLQWQAPNGYAAGWHQDSARLGEKGNLVLNGHNNLYGEVFRDLEQLEPGDFIYIFSNENSYQYQIANTMILLEKYQELDLRVDNAKWILPTDDQRLTLVTCWPYTSNSHRLIIVARLLSVTPEELK